MPHKLAEFPAFVDHSKVPGRRRAPILSDRYSRLPTSASSRRHCGAIRRVLKSVYVPSKFPRGSTSGFVPPAAATTRRRSTTSSQLRRPVSVVGRGCGAALGRVGRGSRGRGLIRRGSIEVRRRFQGQLLIFHTISECGTYLDIDEGGEEQGQEVQQVPEVPSNRGDWVSPDSLAGGTLRAVAEDVGHLAVRTDNEAGLSGRTDCWVFGETEMTRGSVATSEKDSSFIRDQYKTQQTQPSQSPLQRRHRQLRQRRITRTSRCPIGQRCRLRRSRWPV